jgi:hypothetical protein
MNWMGKNPMKTPTMIMTSKIQRRWRLGDSAVNPATAPRFTILRIAMGSSACGHSRAELVVFQALPTKTSDNEALSSLCLCEPAPRMSLPDEQLPKISAQPLSRSIAAQRVCDVSPGGILLSGTSNCRAIFHADSCKIRLLSVYGQNRLVAIRVVNLGVPVRMHKHLCHPICSRELSELVRGPRTGTSGRNRSRGSPGRRI